MKICRFPAVKVVIGLISALVIQVCFGLIMAQTGRPIGINPVMKVSNLSRAEENPMRLDILKVDIKVVGQIAVTTLDMTYFNSNSRVMEGEFNFPLGEGQTVSRFALDMNGFLREGVVVDKELGRKTFEAVIRRGVDPGLLEMTAGNNFRSRVYPLPAQGSRRIVLSFEQELTDKGLTDLYILPMSITENVRIFSLHVTVVKNQVTADAVNNEFNNIVFKKWDNAFVADFLQNNYTPDKQIALSFPHNNEAAGIFTALNGQTDSSYFYLNIRPKLIEKTKQSSKRITLLWDNSGSGLSRNVEKEFDLLGAYFKAIGSISIELIPFNIGVAERQLFVIENGRWEKLKTALREMIYDGGTSFGKLDFRKFKSDEIFLFSDGISNFGSSDPVFSSTPVMTINSSVTANHSFLKYLAQRSGGCYVNLATGNVLDALSQLTTSKLQFVSAQVENGAVSGIYPSMPCSFKNSFSLAGMMKGNTATILLNFGFGTEIVYTKRVVITADNSSDVSFLRRIWAEKKLAELNLEEEKNSDEITRVGKTFGIVTRNTSLIVLDNISQYLQYHILPPEEMQKEYLAQVLSIDKDSKQKVRNHVDYVLQQMEIQSKWWNTDFKIIAEKPLPKSKSGQGVVQFHAPVVTDSITEYTVSSSPRAVVMESESDESTRLEEVVVIGYGTMKRSDPTGSIASMPSADIAVSGRVAGVRISQGNQMSSDIRMNTGSVKENTRQSDIQLNAWDPQTPYIKVLQYAVKGQEYPTYLKLKADYGNTPSFFIDASDFFLNLGSRDTAVRILSNLAELKLESPELLRVLGQKLQAFQRTADAVVVFKKVLQIKGEEPQSYRDLGLAYEANGEFQQALATCYEVIQREWDGRFPGIEVIVMNEINSLIARHPKLNVSFMDSRLLRKEPVDVRVVLSWDIDNCDMDLWVTDPRGEKCFYSHNSTLIGGKITNDFTQGYGPEEFMLKNAVEGKYTVQANYYGTRSQSLLVPVTLHLMFITNFGRPSQVQKEVIIRLDTKQDVIDVGSFSFNGK